MVLIVYLNGASIVNIPLLSHLNNTKYPSLSLIDVPACISSDIKNASDKDFVVYTLKYNEMMTPRLNSLLSVLSDEEYRLLVSSEIARQEEESARMKSVYEAEVGKAYSSGDEETPLLDTIPFPDDALSGEGLTDEDRMSLLRGILEHIGSSYYAIVFRGTSNSVLKENALDFDAYKTEFVAKLGSSEKVTY
jgi:hypothetical protein